MIIYYMLDSNSGPVDVLSILPSATSSVVGWSRQTGKQTVHFVEP